MCLVLCAWQTHPRYPFIMLTNRDEYFTRPSSKSSWWPHQDAQQNIYAGQDLVGGGSWLASNRAGRVCTLTNFRAPQNHQKKAPSRGKIITDLASSEQSLGTQISRLVSDAKRYNSFNLLCFEPGELHIFESTTSHHQQLDSGIYGLSNALLDAPWPKLISAKAGFTELLNKADPQPEEFCALMRNQKRVRRLWALPKTGIGLLKEYLLSSIFIAAPGYGTRSTHLVLLDQYQQMQVHDWYWDEHGQANGKIFEQFSLEKSAS